MKRRTFTKKTSTLVAGSILAGSQFNCSHQAMRKNWAGNLTFSTKNLSLPKDLAALQSTIKNAGKMRALGTAHSFNSIANSKYQQVSIKHWQTQPQLDEASMTVSIPANVRYGDLAIWLHERGYALHNLASLPHISVAGAVSTATHGSGDLNGNLSTAVVALELIKSDGHKISLSEKENPEEFYGTVVGLGALGIITSLTLKIEPTFNVRQDLFLSLPIENLSPHFDKITAAGYSVSMFTDWQTDFINQIWVKSKLGHSTEFNLRENLFGAMAADRKIHPIIEIDPKHCTDQMGQSGPWHDRLPHFKLAFTPSSGDELQSEYFVPRRHAVDALLSIQKLAKHIGPHLLISEIRTIAADRFWMSPCYNEACVAIHFTWKPHIVEVQKLLSMIEDTLTSFEVRPHWGKLFNLPQAYLADIYKKLPDFKALIERNDPTAKFRNDFIDRNIFGLT